MKIIRVFTALLLVMVLSSATLVKKDGGVYVFGVTSSFSDSVVYFTEIQFLDTLKLDKGGILPEMNSYSSQLENYVGVMKNKPNQTAATFYSTKRSSLVKERTKLSNRYKKKLAHSIQFLPIEDFTYTRVAPEED
mgnify:CR=1 FL=1